MTVLGRSQAVAARQEKAEGDWRETLGDAACQSPLLVSCFAAVAASLVVSPGLDGVLGACLGVLTIAIAVVDSRHFIIPDPLVMSAVALAIVAGTAGDSTVEERLLTDLTRAAVAAGAFWALRAGYMTWRGREGIGLGDVKLAAVAGVWLDWSTLLFAIEAAAVAALATQLVRAAAGRRPIGLADRLPFGLYLAPAIWSGWFVEAIQRLD